MAQSNWPKDKALPGSSRSWGDMGVDGASVKDNNDGGKHVTVWNADESMRYSWDTDSSGNLKAGSSHLTDAAAKLLGVNPETGKPRW